MVVLCFLSIAFHFFASELFLFLLLLFCCPYLATHLDIALYFLSVLGAEGGVLWLKRSYICSKDLWVLCGYKGLRVSICFKKVSFFYPGILDMLSRHTYCILHAYIFISKCHVLYSLTYTPGSYKHSHLRYPCVDGGCFYAVFFFFYLHWARHYYSTATVGQFHSTPSETS